MFAVVFPAIMLFLRFAPSFAGEHLSHLFGQMVGGIAPAGTFWIAGAVTMSIAGLVGYTAYVLVQPSDKRVIRPSKGFKASVKACCAWLLTCLSGSSTNQMLPNLTLGAATMPERQSFDSVFLGAGSSDDEERSDRSFESGEYGENDLVDPEDSDYDPMG
jgi:hypothetical protein